MKDEALTQEMADKYYEETMTNWTWKVRVGHSMSVVQRPHEPVFEVYCQAKIVESLALLTDQIQARGARLSGAGAAVTSGKDGS